MREYLLTTQDGLVGEMGEMLRCCTDPFCGTTSSSCHTTSRVSDNVCRLSCDSPTCICLPSLVFFSFFFLSLYISFFLGFVFCFFFGFGFFAVWLDITQERRSIVGRLIDQNRSQNFLSLSLSLSLSVCLCACFFFSWQANFHWTHDQAFLLARSNNNNICNLVLVGGGANFLLLGRKRRERILFIIQSCSKNTADLEFHNNNNTTHHHYHHHHHHQQQQTKNNQ